MEITRKPLKLLTKFRAAWSQFMQMCDALWLKICVDIYFFNFILYVKSTAVVEQKTKDFS